MSDTALILLAAGSSSRLGMPKQLLDFHGTPMVRHAAETALRAGCGPVVVVLGAVRHEIAEALQGLPVEIVSNDQWAEGMGTSIQCGLRALEGRGVCGAILSLADQPFVTATFLRSLLTRHIETGRNIVAASYAGTVGVPVFFAAEAFGLLMALKPAAGCKGVILGHPEDALLIDCAEAAIDIDTLDDYLAVLERLSDFGYAAA